MTDEAPANSSPGLLDDPLVAVLHQRSLKIHVRHDASDFGDCRKLPTEGARVIQLLRNGTDRKQRRALSPHSFYVLCSWTIFSVISVPKPGFSGG